MGGRIDTFFWERFGGALLLSIVGDAGDAVSNRVSGVDQTMETPNTAAAIAAQDSQRIRPRLTAPQGREMTIMVARDVDRSEEHTSELQSLMRISYAVFCLKKKKRIKKPNTSQPNHTRQARISKRNTVV